MAELLFYRKLVALDKDRHRHLRVDELRDCRFAVGINSVPLAAAEFIEAAREYPIVFAGQPGTPPAPAALLGLRANENLFVGESGKWLARYIPAFVRRYPFAPAQTDDGQLLVCIDEACHALGDLNGQALFAQNGQATPFLDKAIGFLRGFQVEIERTVEFMQRIAELDLLTEVSARTEIRGSTAHQLGGFSVVNETRYRALDMEAVEELFRKGWISFIEAHLLSLGHLASLTDRMTKAGKKIA